MEDLLAELEYHLRQVIRLHDDYLEEYDSLSYPEKLELEDSFAHNRACSAWEDIRWLI